MKSHGAYLYLSHAAFFAACLLGLSAAMSYLRFVQENSWLAWKPGVGVALLFAAAVMCYVGQRWFLRDAVGSTRFFPLCLAAFVAACTTGLSFGLDYLQLVHARDWAAWKPGVGMAIIFASMLLSFCGYALAVQHAKKQTTCVAV